METQKNTFQLSGKGLIVAPPANGMPSMRRLVEIYTDADKNRYIKLDGEFTLLTFSHMLI